MNRLCLSVLAALAFLAGCARDDSGPAGSELDDGSYLRGQQLVNQGRPQEALAAYLKVIARRGEGAPESHLSAGLIYLQDIKDPVTAIYYFRKYLELQPNSKKSDLVRQRIDVAKREFARTLPQPLENAADRLETLDQLGRLQRENEQLKAELAAQQGEAPPMISSSRFGLAPAAEAPPIAPAEAPADSPITLAPLNQPPAGDRPVVESAPLPRAGGHPPGPAPAPPAGRTHVVAAHETLYGLAKKYYGAATNAKVQAIRDANRGVLPADGALKPGLELKIP